MSHIEGKKLTKTALKKLTTQKNKLVRSKKKKINIYLEIDNFLFYNKELLPEVLENKTQFRTAIYYLFETFMKFPNLMVYLDKHLNGKIEGLISHQPYDILVFYKKIIFENGIKSFELYKKFPDRTFYNNINNIVSKKGYTIFEAKDYYINRKVKNPLELESLFENKLSKKTDDLEIARKALYLASENQNAKIQEEKETDSNIDDFLFLTDLNNDIIKKYELTLFNINVLKNSNEFLFTFIDLNHNKKYYKMPFSAEIFINTKTGVLNNDYIEDISPDFQKYTITNYSDLSTLKYLLNNTYVNFMKNI